MDFSTVLTSSPNFNKTGTSPLISEANRKTLIHLQSFDFSDNYLKKGSNIVDEKLGPASNENKNINNIFNSVNKQANVADLFCKIFNKVLLKFNTDNTDCSFCISHYKSVIRNLNVNNDSSNRSSYNHDSSNRSSYNNDKFIVDITAISNKQQQQLLQQPPRLSLKDRLLSSPRLLRFRFPRENREAKESAPKMEVESETTKRKPKPATLKQRSQSAPRLGIFGRFFERGLFFRRSGDFFRRSK
ncbi:hypothetical protein HELRODRAFT_182187 [Helobdella robusta]|uniref:Uncharacterized protein n=1 Tax=Helobdella robusta TaxID=6412 RepID=T1FHW5_HELRO|nr:hypothetical protein HELRODRAFT_182187 [Helobdella robusta]ESN91215.1 hypothetical protein HELRODRAFT_182187 [Helobdella robusta]